MEPNEKMKPDLIKAASCGEPSYIWREGQQRRFGMVLEAAGERVRGRVLENGCGVGMYVNKLTPHVGMVIGLEFDFERSLLAHENNHHIINSTGERLPFPDQCFDLVLSHEVLEHVKDDRKVVLEMVRTLKTGGRAVVFTPNRGYPFETHGFYWLGKYKFGNIPLINWLPRTWRDKLAPHVRVYSIRDMRSLFLNLPVCIIESTVIFGAYDNIIARYGFIGQILRSVLQFLENTALRVFGLSHFWVVEKL